LIPVFFKSLIFTKMVFANNAGRDETIDLTIIGIASLSRPSGRPRKDIETYDMLNGRS
jgi:hypothetical protein